MSIGRLHEALYLYHWYLNLAVVFRMHETFQVASLSCLVDWILSASRAASRWLIPNELICGNCNSNVSVMQHSEQLVPPLFKSALRSSYWTLNPTMRKIQSLFPSLNKPSSIPANMTQYQAQVDMLRSYAYIPSMHGWSSWRPMLEGRER